MTRIAIYARVFTSAQNTDTQIAEYQMLTDHLYVGMEAYHIAFKEKTVPLSDLINLSITPNFTYGGVTVGYKFSSSCYLWLHLRGATSRATETLEAPISVSALIVHPPRERML